MALRTRDQDDFIKRNFQTIWPAHLAGFTRLLTQLRVEFDGDLDLLLVLSVIGERTRPENWSPELRTYRQLTIGAQDAHRQYPINMQSVSEYSGIPRETVRRKVAILCEKGWVTRDAEGRLAVARSAAADLEGATDATIAYLAAVLGACDRARDPSDIPDA